MTQRRRGCDTRLARAARARSLGVVDLANGFAAALPEELDFQVEARNVAAVSAVGVLDYVPRDVRLNVPGRALGVRS